MENIYEIILSSSSPFLIAENGEWINANRKIIMLEDMDDEYLNNCYKTMLHDEDAVKQGDHLSGLERRFPILKDEKEKTKVIEKCCILFDQKLSELVDILNK